MAMLELEGILTERVQKLLTETEDLKSGAEISIKEMTDQNQLTASDGALVSGNMSGESIYLDPKRADEYKLAHEIMHIKLFRSGWPKIYPMIQQDQLTMQLTPRLGNLIEHYLIYPEIQNMGIDMEEYEENFIGGYEDWTVDESIGLHILDFGITICEGLLFGEPIRAKVIGLVEKNYPNSLDLALKLEEIVTSGEPNKKNTHKSSVSLVKFVNDWIHKQNKQAPDLIKTIGITPLFTVDELNKRASKYVHFNSERLIIEGNVHYIAFFFLKVDKSRFLTFISEDDKEPNYIPDIRRQWQTKSLNELLSFLNVPWNYQL